LFILINRFKKRFIVNKLIIIKLNKFEIHKKFVNYYFLFIIALHIPLFYYFYLLNSNGGDYWLSADWILSYDFGFIRRGLFGSILNLLTSNPETKLVILSLVLSFLYITIIFLIYKIYTSTNQNFISLTLLVSPIFIIFPLLDFRGSFRKELLGFTSLLLIYQFFNKFKRSNKRFFLLIAYIISIFSSEVNFLFLPFIVIYIYENRNSSKYKIYIFEYLSTSILYILLFFLTSESVDKNLDLICNDLLNNNYSKNICEGSIRFMKFKFNETIGYVLASITKEKIYGYFILTIFSFLPFISDINWLIKNKNKILMSVLYFTPFFFIAMDWGRWLYIYFSCLIIEYFNYQDKKSNNKYLLFLIPINFLTWNVNHFYEDIETVIKNFLHLNHVKYIELIEAISKLT